MNAFDHFAHDGLIVRLQSPPPVVRLRHFGFSLFAWVFALVSVDATSDLPRRPYRIVVLNAQTGELFHDEGVLRGQDALDAFAQDVKDLQRIGASDFLYKKEHGWRID